MPRHNCTKHPFRGRSRYPDRLRKRGLSKTPQMASVEGLRTRQDRRVRDGCSVNHSHDITHCDGHAWQVITTDDD